MNDRKQLEQVLHCWLHGVR